VVRLVDLGRRGVVRLDLMLKEKKVHKIQQKSA